MKVASEEEQEIGRKETASAGATGRGRGRRGEGAPWMVNGEETVRTRRPRGRPLRRAR